MFAPLEGEVIEVNEALDSEPELINSAPFGEGWIFAIKPTNIEDVEALMDADAYEAFYQE